MEYTIPQSRHGEIHDSRDHAIFVHSELDDIGLSAQEFRIYGHLARRVGRNHHAWPSLTGMAEKCKLNRHTVINAIQGLLERGLIRVEKNPGRMNHYILTPRKEWVVSKGALPKRGTGGSAKRGTAPVSKEAHEGTPPRLSNEGTPSCDGFSLIPFIDIWKERFGACFETTTTAKRFKALSRTHGQSAAVEMFRLYVAGVDAKYASVNSFLQKPLAYTAKQAKGGEFPEDDMEVAHIC